MAFSSKRKITIRDLEEGDLIEFYRAMGTFSHWAVYVGNEEVIHLSPNPDDANLVRIKSGTSVRKENIKKVAEGSNTYRNNEFDDELRPFSKADIVKRAKERLGGQGYHLRSNNCEHFATECRYGEARSKQVNAIEERAYDWITPSVYRVWQTGDATKFLAPHVRQIVGKVVYSPPGDLVIW